MHNGALDFQLVKLSKVLAKVPLGGYFRGRFNAN